MNAIDEMYERQIRTLEKENVRLKETEEELREARDWLNEKLDTLLMAVANKYPGESRYETALRYIRERESSHVRGGKP